MRDLRSYRDVNKTQSPIAAAKARGLTFATLADLQREEPFWQQSGANGKGLLSHALTVTPKRYAELWCDPNTEMVWMSLDEALQCTWIDLEKRKIFDDAYEGVLSDLLARNEKRKMADGLYAIAGPKSRSTQKKGAGKTSV